MSRKTVLVSGAGIAGTTIAYWLRHYGFTPVLVERAPEFRQGGYIIDFWGVGFDVAERMGLIPEVREAGYRIDRIEFVAPDGSPRSAVTGNMFARSLGDRFLSIQRADLANAIYRTIEDDVEVIYGDSVTDIRENLQCAEVTFEHSRPRSFDLVIGADGLHSAVRSALFGP
ncbi:MAG: FAD-dependent monooxygenase, partial [Bryobacteraceae bacterium]